MAIWQFRICLIPTEVIIRRFGSVPNSLPKDAAEDWSWWPQSQTVSGLAILIGAILPEATSWSSDVLIWGEKHGDMATIVVDANNNLESVEFRIDVRNLSDIYIKRICALAKRLMCVLVTATYDVLLPEESSLLDAINASTSRKFVEDPVATLKKLDIGSIEPFQEDEAGDIGNEL